MMLCSADMLKKLQPYENVSHYEIGALSTLLINLGQEKIAYELLSELKRDEKNRVILNSWLRAASANNKRTEIEEFTNGPSFYLITERTIKDSFYIASNHKFDALALFFTEMLVHNNPSQENRSLHALALTHNKQYDRAAKLIIALKDEGVDVGQHYEYILFQAAKRSATYRDYYVNHLVSQLNAPDLTPEKEERTVHDVVAFGGEELVLERIKLAAHSKGGMWAELYVTALRKLGMDEKINAFEKKRNKEILKEEVPKQVAKKPVKKPSKLEQAKALIAKGKITQAENILLALGKNKSPRNHANELLLYLWGLRPTDTRLNKISEIVSSSSIHRKAWLQALYYAGGYRQFVDFVKENPSWLKHETFYEFYLQSHLHLGETERVRQLMEENIRATKSAKRLMWNGDKALQYGMYDLAREAYLKAVELMPDNVDVKLAERLTRAFFLVEDFEKTLHYGELYKEMEGPSPVPYYYVGDTLWRQFKPDEAREYFSDTLARIKKSGGAKTRDIRLIRAASLVRLEQYEQARQAVAELIEEDPLDTFLQADYLQILLEMKDYDAADAYSRTVVLETLKEVELPKAAALTLRRVQNPSEVVISSPKDEALLESTIALLKKNAVWLESSHSGFQHMVLKTAQDHAFYWKKHRNSSTITLGVKPHLFDDASVKKRKDLEVRIALLKARLKTEQGMRYDARKILKEIDSKYPDDPHILSALAYNHFAFKRFMNAFKDMDKALQQLPENDQIQDGRFEIRRFVPPYVLADIEWQKLGNDSQVRLLLEGKIVNRHNLGAVARKRMNFYDAKGIRKSDGRFGDFSGTAFDFTLGVFKEHKEGQLWSAEIYNNGEFTGFGGEFSMINRSGAATARVEYHKAVWDFVEGVSDNAVRDRFQLSQHFTRSPLIQSDVAVSINEYHVESANSVAESIALESHIRVPAIYIDEDWYEPLSFGYGLDAEYRTSIERAIDSTGVEYSLYPLVSREVHFFDIAYRDEIDENSLLEGYVGYAFDRLGDSGASTGFKWTHDITDHLQGQIRAGYGVSLTQTSVGLGTFGGYLKYHF
jgi:tetratricopeptide (TPR) repeat protein